MKHGFPDYGRAWARANGLPIHELHLDHGEVSDPAAARARMIAENANAWRGTKGTELRTDSAEQSTDPYDAQAAHARMVRRNASAWRGSQRSEGSDRDLRADAADSHDAAGARARMIERNAAEWRGDSAGDVGAVPVPPRAPAAPASASQAPQLGSKTMDAIIDRVLGTLSPDARAALRLDGTAAGSHLRYGESLPLRGYDFEE